MESAMEDLKRDWTKVQIRIDSSTGKEKKAYLILQILIENLMEIEIGE